MLHRKRINWKLQSACQRDLRKRRRYTKEEWRDWSTVCVCARARVCMPADAVITRLACRWRCVSSGEAWGSWIRFTPRSLYSFCTQVRTLGGYLGSSHFFTLFSHSCCPWNIGPVVGWLCFWSGLSCPPSLLVFSSCVCLPGLRPAPLDCYCSHFISFSPLINF